ncbi:MAG: hypothetical protein NWE93_12515 [Candidatus Bathyarchaeota archaeon]|nr:hypothetical protein [Candidatus Bathyarchaeota archaeon]
MGAIKSLAQGFLVATGIVWIFNVAALIRGGDAWLGLLYLLILILAASSIALLKLRPQAHPEKADPHRWHNLLFAFQGAALAFWSLDLITTFYAINVTGLAIELNPLGWPLGILGALAFYGPVLAFSYVLLFRLKEKISLIAAVPLTALTLWMASMNLVAGAQNFQVFVDTAALAVDVRFGLLAVVVVLDFVVPLTIKRLFSASKPYLALQAT